MASDDAEAAVGASSAGVFFEGLDRSLPLKEGQVLLGDIAMRARLVCTDEDCCSDNAVMLDRRREHAVRSRARVLAGLNQQPHHQWRLHTVSNHAQAAVALARQASSVLEANGIKHQIGVLAEHRSPRHAPSVGAPCHTVVHLLCTLGSFEVR